MVDYVCTNGHMMNAAGVSVPNYRVVARCQSTDELIAAIENLTDGQQHYADELGLFVLSLEI